MNTSNQFTSKFNLYKFKYYLLYSINRFSVSAIFLWKAVRPYVPEFFFNHLLPLGRKFKADLKVLHGFSNKVISDRRRLLKREQQNLKKDDAIGAKKRLSFLDLLLEASDGGKILSDTDIREEVDTFMFEVSLI